MEAADTLRKKGEEWVGKGKQGMGNGMARTGRRGRTK